MPVVRRIFRDGDAGLGDLEDAERAHVDEPLAPVTDGGLDQLVGRDDVGLEELFPAARGLDAGTKVIDDVAAGQSVEPGIDVLEVALHDLGAATGGPQALNHVLPQLPADFPASVLIVQHMPPVFTKSLADDLDKRCQLKVSEAVDGQPVVPGHVLIAPGGKQMKVTREGGQATVCITDDPPENSCRPSVDYLFRSVTRCYGPNAVGVIMTGMGNDGSQGCRQMKQRGATIIAQDEASCVVFGMPRELVEEGIADMVGSPDAIAAEIVRLVRRGAVLCK